MPPTAKTDPNIDTALTNTHKAIMHFTDEELYTKHYNIACAHAAAATHRQTSAWIHLQAALVQLRLLRQSLAFAKQFHEQQGQ